MSKNGSFNEIISMEESESTIAGGLSTLAAASSDEEEGNEDSNKIEEFESPNGKRKIVATFEKDFCRIEFQPKSDETGNESSPCSRKTKFRTLEIDYEDVIAVISGGTSTIDRRKKTGEQDENSNTKGLFERLLRKSSDGSDRQILPLPIKTTATGSHLKVFYVTQKAKNPNIFRKKSLELFHPDFAAATHWIKNLQTRRRKFSRNQPRNLLVIINPYGGKREARSIFEKRVTPILRVCGIPYDFVETKNAGHAEEFLRTRHLANYDGIVCVGGDGVLNEVVTGLIKRFSSEQNLNVEQPENSLSPISGLRLGLVPGGSTNSVSLSVNGTEDVETAILRIVRGDSRNIDVSGVYANDKLIRFSMTMASFGYFGDLLKRSEKYRWLGPKRYDVSGTQTLLQNRGYRGKITYWEDEDADTPGSTLKRCYEGCSCGSESVTSQKRLVKKVIEGKFGFITVATMTCCSPHTARGVAPSAHFGDGNADLILVKGASRVNNLRYLWNTNQEKRSVFDLPFVEGHRVEKVVFELRDKAKKVEKEDAAFWNVDGELCESTNITVKVHRQIVPFFGKGPCDP